MAHATTPSSHAAGHVAPLGVYWGIFLALMVFTAITTKIAFVDLGFLNNVVALGIAGFKATLVVLYFMHVRHSTKMVPITIVSGLFFLLILLAIVMADYFSRGWLGVAGR